MNPCVISMNVPNKQAGLDSYTHRYLHILDSITTSPLLRHDFHTTLSLLNRRFLIAPIPIRCTRCCIHRAATPAGQIAVHITIHSFPFLFHLLAPFLRNSLLFPSNRIRQFLLTYTPPNRVPSLTRPRLLVHTSPIHSHLSTTSCLTHPSAVIPPVLEKKESSLSCVCVRTNRL